MNVEMKNLAMKSFMNQSKLTAAVFLISSKLFVETQAQNSDVFNFGFSSSSYLDGGTNYGQNEWDRVRCDDLDTCLGFPDKFEGSIGFTAGNPNNCKFCVEGGPESCGLHRQSPIDLKRDRGIIGNPNEKECPDWHWMTYRDDTCSWDDMKDQFSVQRQALKIQVPIASNGEIDCVDPTTGIRQYGRLDYSKGFPDWWWLDHTSISVPSHHVQEGKQYDAEVNLAHFYEIDHPKNKLGSVSIFLQAYDNVESWDYLDKIICSFRLEEEKTRASCGLPPAEPYGRCQLFRGQPPTEDWLREAGLLSEPTTAAPSTPAPVPAPVPVPVPVSNPGVELTLPPFLSSLGKFSFSGVIGVETAEEQVPTPNPSATLEVAGEEDTISSAPSDQPSLRPSLEPSVAVEQGEGSSTIPSEFNCDSPVSFDRMCNSNAPCCNSVRGESTYCWDIYENVFPGDNITAACYYCCPEQKVIGPPNPIKEGVPKTITCSSVENVQRMCKPNSCCTNPRSTSGYCQGVYQIYGDDMEQICHYCCSESKEVGPPMSNRYLRASGMVNETMSLKFNEADSRRRAKDDHIPNGAKIGYYKGQKRVLREENFDPDEEDEQQYFDRIYERSKQRSMQQVVHDDDYADVEYWPYEWLVKVGTEYYYRYEGTETFPPCMETVHWRVMKDPIQVAPRQIAELSRLLAWRRNERTCEVDTAGVLSPDGNSVKANREVQYYHLQHRMLFCECKDWPSKFVGDQEWCRGWREDTTYARFYEYPYNFDSGGQFRF